MLGMATHPGRFVVRNEIQWVGRSGVFSYLTAVEVRNAAGIERHVFNQAAKTINRRPNQRFILRIDANGFRVAAAFKVENTFISPAVFVIPNQGPLRVGG